jgi:hypothetical protein
MVKQNLPATEVVQPYPYTENAFVYDIRPITGDELKALGNYVMAQDMDVASDADGFFMQLPAYARKMDIYAYNWTEAKFTKLDKANRNYPNVYKVSPAHISSAPFAGHSYEAPGFPGGNGVSIASALNTRVVRIAAIPGSGSDPAPRPDEYAGKNHTDRTFFTEAGATADVTQSERNGTINVTIKNDELYDGAWVTFFFYGSNNPVSIVKQVSAAGGGKFKADFTTTDLEANNLPPGTVIEAIQYSFYDNNEVFRYGYAYPKQGGIATVGDTVGCNVGFSLLILLIIPFILRKR